MSFYRRAKRLLRKLSVMGLDALLLQGALARLSFRLGLHGKLGVSRLQIRVEGYGLPSVPLVVAFASDFHAGATTSPDRLRAGGVQVLANSHASLPTPYEQVSICGIEDPITGRPDAKQAFAGAGPVRIFLTHAPDGILLPQGATFDVAFAGHTHGGQIAPADRCRGLIPEVCLTFRVADLCLSAEALAAATFRCESMPILSW